MILVGMTRITILMIAKCIHHMMSHISVIALQIYTLDRSLVYSESRIL